MSGFTDAGSARTPMACAAGPLRQDDRSTSQVRRIDAAAVAPRNEARLQDADGLRVLAPACDPGACGPGGDPARCGFSVPPEVIADAAESAEVRLARAIQGAGDDRSMLGQLAAATRHAATLQSAAEILAAVPDLALRFQPARAAAVLRLADDGRPQVVARKGPAFDVSATRLAAALRGAVPPPARGGARARGGSASLLVPLADGVERWALALDVAGSRPALCERELERLAVFAATINTALARARAGAALAEAVARDAAALEAVRDGIIGVDRCGIVRSLNQAAAAALGLRREDLLGRSLGEFPSLVGLRRALGAPGDLPEVVRVGDGEVVLRAQAYDHGVVATLRDAPTEQMIAHRMVGSVARHRFEDLVGRAPAFLRVIEEARRAARGDVPVLIRGESGTGKEMLAQAIHNASQRAGAPFLGINVTAIPRELLESELFGYEGGTFTGARASGRGGKFELVGKGTLLLDEIGDMPLEMQGKLLRVLQERVVQRLGSVRDVQIRARVVATTHRDLADAVEGGRFRLDLYHRLRVLELTLPPLRERREDIPLIVEHQLRMHAQATRRRVNVSPRVLAALQEHDWPGNVRELTNLLEGELSLLAAGEDQLMRIPPALQSAPRATSAAVAGIPSAVMSLEELERHGCEQALAAFGGNVARAAEALGVAKGTLYSKMKRYGLGGPAPTPVPSLRRA